jgi:hypothetical protein
MDYMATRRGHWGELISPLFCPNLRKGKEMEFVKIRTVSKLLHDTYASEPKDVIKNFKSLSDAELESLKDAYKNRSRSDWADSQLVAMSCILHG